MMTEINIVLTFEYLVTISVQSLLLQIRKLLPGCWHLGQAALTTEVEHHNLVCYLRVEKFGKMPRPRTHIQN